GPLRRERLRRRRIRRRWPRRARRAVGRKRPGREDQLHAGRELVSGRRPSMALSKPLCGVEAMGARLGLQLSGAEHERALAALTDASALVRSVAGDDFLDADGELETTIPDVVVQVTLAAALRCYRNPDGVQRAQ